MIHEFAIYAAKCLGSGAILSSLCAIVIVPVLSWLTIRLLMPRIRKLDGDASWQGPIAAAAVLVPAALLVGLLIINLFRGGSPCLDYIVGRGIAVALGAWILVAFSRATWLAVRRYREARMLVSCSQPATGNLFEMARVYGLSVRILPNDEPLCALTGLFRPVVLMSSAAADILSEAELRAALRHESAHARRGDLIVGSLVSFCLDLLPLPASALHEMYLSAREFAADREAVRQESAEALASALIALSRGKGELRGAVALASKDTIRPRLRELLFGRPAPDASIAWRRTVMISALAVLLVGGLMPAADGLLHRSPCLMSDMVSP